MKRSDLACPTVMPAAIAALLLAGCGGADDSGPTAREREETAPAQAPNAPGVVAMKDVEFVPARLEIKVGDKVTWRNDEALDHNVVAEQGARFRSRAFGQGNTYTFTAKKPGTIDYVCTLHPGMEGQLVVTAR